MAKKVHTLIPSHNPLPRGAREQMADELGTLVAGALDLYSHAKMAHWNVRGTDFMALHELFEKVADGVREHADELAERAGQLGAGIDATIRSAAKKSPLKEYGLGIASGQEHVERLSESMSAFGKHLLDAIERAEDAKDPVTQDVLTTICRDLDKMMWFVESHGKSATRSLREAV